MTNSHKCQVLMRSLQIIVSNYAMWDVAHVENNSWNGPDRIHQRACATAHLLKKIHPFKDFGGNIQFNPAYPCPPYDSDMVKCTVCHGPLSWQLTPSMRGLGTRWAHSKHTGGPLATQIVNRDRIGPETRCSSRSKVDSSPVSTTRSIKQQTNKHILVPDMNKKDMTKNTIRDERF